MPPTFGELEFPSDDDESDAVELSSDSDSSSSSSDEKPHVNAAEERRQAFIVKAKRKRFAAFVSKRLEDKILVERPHMLKSNGFFREFVVPQRKCDTLKNSSKEELFDYLERCTGSKKPEQPLKVREYKQALTEEHRALAGASNYEAITAAVKSGEIQNSEQLIHTVIHFAGQSYGVQKRVRRDSRKYRNYLKQCEGGSDKLGGALSNLDQAVEALKGPAKITSIEKSTLDWEEFKRNNVGLETELAGTERDGYIARQAFLSNVQSRKNNVLLSRDWRRS